MEAEIEQAVPPQKPEVITAKPETPKAVEPRPTITRPAEPVPPPVTAATPAEKAPETPPPPGVTSKKIVIPKAKTKILMRTSTEKVVTHEISDRILKGLRDEKPSAPKAITQTKLVKKKKLIRQEAPVRTAKVIDLPKPPASPEDFKPIAITEGVTIKELAEKMDIKSKYIIQKLISKGILASINQSLDLDAAKEVCALK